MKFYCIYDNLYEEYQQPFVMKNDNIAKIEFEMFVNSMVDKAPEKEKSKTRNRFLLCSFKELIYEPTAGIITIAKDDKYINIVPETMTLGEENE